MIHCISLEIKSQGGYLIPFPDLTQKCSKSCFQSLNPFQITFNLNKQLLDCNKISECEICT